MPAQLIQTSYNGGELSARMEGRVDAAIYAISAAEMVNFVPTIEGPAQKRSGWRYIHAAMASASWLSEFIFSRTQAYVIEWGEALLRFYTNGGVVETAPGSGIPYELVVPYTAAEAPHVGCQQSFDRLYMAHPAHPPASLTRLTATTFSHDVLNLIGGPFADQNSTEANTVTVTGSLLVIGGVVTITCTAAIFTAAHVGALFRVEARDLSDVKPWQAQMQVVAGDRRRVGDRVYLVQAGGATRTGTIEPTHTRGTEWDGQNYLDDINGKGPFGVPLLYQHDRIGIGQITAVDPLGMWATVTVTRPFPTSLQTVPSFRWSHQAISAAAGYPKDVVLAFGRLCFFTDFEIMASTVADYGGGRVNFSPYADNGEMAPDMAFRRRLDISNPILWAVADRDGILIGTAEGEYAIRKADPGEIFSTENIACTPQSKYGGAAVHPAQTGPTIFFIQKSGCKVREANYEFSNDRYVSPNIAVWHRHILKSGARQLAFQQEPDELLWIVRNDGWLAVHPHVPEQDIKGFSRVYHGGGAVRSLVSIPSEDGALDEAWALVDCGGVLSIELQARAWLEDETAIEDAFFVDSGVTVEAPASTTITGATWLADKQVAILADGGVLPLQYVASDGSLTLPLDAPPAKVTFGYPYEARLKWLRPEMRGPTGGTSQGQRKRLTGIVARLIETLGLQIDPGTGKADNIIDRHGSSTMDEPNPLFSGDTANKPVAGNWERDGQGTFLHSDPLPCMIVAHMPRMEVGG